MVPAAVWWSGWPSDRPAPPTDRARVARRRARPWRLGQRGLDAAARRWASRPGCRCPRHRPAQAQGRGRRARLPRRARRAAADAGRPPTRRRRPLVRRPRGVAAGRRRERARRAPEPSTVASPALVCFSYPLHLPGRPEKGLRTEHWPAIRVPTLILEGESDPFARIELLRGAMPLLPHGGLVTWPGLGHGLGAGPGRGARCPRRLARRRRSIG